MGERGERREEKEEETHEHKEREGGERRSKSHFLPSASAQQQ